MLGGHGSSGASAKNNRLFIDAVLTIVIQKKNWSALPSEFGSWNTVYVRFQRWNKSGFWHFLADNVVTQRELYELLQQVAIFGDEQITRVEIRLIRRRNIAAHKTRMERLK